MDKVKAKEIYLHHRIPTPPYVVIDAVDWSSRRAAHLALIEKAIGYPCILKPSRLGSSVGSAICTDRSELLRAMPRSLRFGDHVLVEKVVRGREVTCAVLDTPGGKPPMALPPTEIVPRAGSYFDYHAKYTPGASDEITPARIGKAMTARIRRTALKAHGVLGCSGMSRTDMIIHGRNLYVLETNTIPGMTEMSLLPQAARAAGLSFARLLDRIITVALESHRETRRYSTARW
jgi:D-alanine-D-alanine ligase